MSGGMTFELSEDQQIIRKSVAELCGKFDDEYWMKKDLAHEFPQEFYDAIASGGWLGMTIPEEYGGHGLGITEATLLLEEVARSGAAMNGASAIHLTIFGMQPVVVGHHLVHGRSWASRLIAPTTPRPRAKSRRPPDNRTDERPGGRPGAALTIVRTSRGIPSQNPPKRLCPGSAKLPSRSVFPWTPPT